jgi:hypothetical protein
MHATGEVTDQAAPDNVPAAGSGPLSTFNAKPRGVRPAHGLDNVRFGNGHGLTGAFPAGAPTRGFRGQHKGRCDAHTVVAPNLEEVTRMVANKKQTGLKAASAASGVLTGPKSTKAEKKAAASALSQTPSKGKK